MPDAPQLLLFIAAGLLLNLTPGPDVLYITRHAVQSGARAGTVAGLGITAGCFVHVFAAALGVSALLATSATAFSVLKWVGAAYLVWLGVKTLMARPASAAPNSDGADARAARPAPERLTAVFMGGFGTNVLNPKVAIFFLAFVPQFIAPEAQHKALIFIVLGTIFNLNSIPVNTGWALVAAALARRVRGDSTQAGVRADHLGRSRLFIWLDRAAGILFIGFGLKLALTDAPIR